MLFNSYEFVFLFLPITFAGFCLLGAVGRYRTAMAWLVGASLFFYGWWNPPFVFLIVSSVLFNYAVGVGLQQQRKRVGRSGNISLLCLGITANLALLGYFKYANFFVDNMNSVLGTDLYLGPVILPLAISFFTFQQIAYLVDLHRGEAKEYDFLSYCLFVTFFPQLIAGPIVHHKEMMPQFAQTAIFRFNSSNVAVGLSIFVIGLFKKVVFADEMAGYATPIFNAAERGDTLTFLEAWGGSLAYTFQLYFDFSGYSDMAIGLARMFGIHLPLNFFSPYKATSIIEFWRRWHMTLSRFLRDYLYIPLGGSRRGRSRQAVNLMITMLLGGLWHGAGWTFVVWGGLHGLYLLVNHLWRWGIDSIGLQGSWQGSTLARALACVVTFLAVIVAWVFFRAESVAGALQILQSMAGFNGLTLPVGFEGRLRGLESVLIMLGAEFRGESIIGIHGWLTGGIPYLLVALVICWFAPNTYEIMARYHPAIADSRMPDAASRKIALTWRPTATVALALSTLALLSILNMSRVSEFIYYEF